jgi:hypothetical protein
MQSTCAAMTAGACRAMFAGRWAGQLFLSCPSVFISMRAVTRHQDAKGVKSKQDQKKQESKGNCRTTHTQMHTKQRRATQTHKVQPSTASQPHLSKNGTSEPSSTGLPRSPSQKVGTSAAHNTLAAHQRNTGLPKCASKKETTGDTRVWPAAMALRVQT